MVLRQTYDSQYERQPLLLDRRIYDRGSQSLLSMLSVRTFVVAVSIVLSFILISLQTWSFRILLPCWPHLIVDSMVRDGHIEASNKPEPSYELLLDKRLTSFRKEQIRVPEHKSGFPSFWNYAPHGPISVGYDARAILLDGTRSLFLGGSMHPVRATPKSWAAALDQAVLNGMNLVTIYVFWSAHQPFPDSPHYDWSLPGNSCNNAVSPPSPCGNWTLAAAIREAANRGLFVHARIGPYVCAEYSYGGIPEWVALNKPNMSMRRPNREWMDAMEGFLKETIEYLTQEELWAYQGGPIILGQVENELGSELDPELDTLITMVDSESGSVKNATMQDYAEWCGATAAKYAPNVLWTMCNGLTATNAVNTCNGYGGVSCSQGWLESHGQSGRIQVDQPALWTENEGGFQVWGETPSQSSYFWGRTGRDFARDGLKWFARGGTHLNYYMFWGGYNRGRQAAGGITNLYANEAMLCPSGEPRHPKYGHLQLLHKLLIDLAPCLLEAPSALLKNQTISILDKKGEWTVGKEQRMFRYMCRSSVPKERVVNEASDETSEADEITFIENDSPDTVVAQLNLGHEGNEKIIMNGLSVIILVNGNVLFDSSKIKRGMKAFRRVTIESPVDLMNWESWEEHVGINPHDPRTKRGVSPMEQTELMISSRISSDYAWYETTFQVDPYHGEMMNASISIGAQMASAMSVYVDGLFFGAQASSIHEEGPNKVVIEFGAFPSEGLHKLSILSENFGYGNLIGRWGFSTKEKTKGITGSVNISGFCQTQRCDLNLSDGREWLSFPGLHGAQSTAFGSGVDRLDTADVSFPSSSAVWSRASFPTPSYSSSSESLFLDIPTGRGHLWLNGHDLGMYWNITRGKTAYYSQRYYLLPTDYMQHGDHLNELLIFNSMGGDHSQTRLVLSRLEADSTATLEDDVDFPSACV